MLAWLLSVAVLQSAWSAPPTALTPPARVAVVGASVSAGFVHGVLTGGSINNDSVPASDVAKALYDKAKVDAFANVWLFRNPARLGAMQVASARAAAPDLTLAVDFLFWFGYGAHHARLKAQAEGLRLLGMLPGEVIVGDYPDMRGASRRMLRPSQIPDAGTLDELNRRVYAFAANRPNVRVFPLARWIHSARAHGYRWRTPKGCVVTLPAKDLFQSDRLHASRLGMAVLGLELARFVGTRRGLVTLAKKLGAEKALLKAMRASGCR